MADLMQGLLVPQWAVGLAGLLVALLCFMRSNRGHDGVKISQAFAWATFGLAYLWLQFTNVPLGDPSRPFVVRSAIFFLLSTEILNQSVMLFYGKRRSPGE